jgi:NADH-quinone oxidoreductase subunit C
MADDATTTTDAPAADDSTAPEVDEVNEGQLATLTDSLGAGIVDSRIAKGTLWVRVGLDAWVHAHEVAKDRLGATWLDFVSGIDWLPSPWGRYEDAALDTGLRHADPDAAFEVGVTGGETRFQVFSRVVDVRHHRAVVFKADVPEDLHVPTITHVYAGANWHERECWEMFGIVFDGHPSLRHLYLPGGFEGHPLRKDFPLLARLVKPWPGIVDVEPMPEVPGEGADGAAGGEPAEAGPGGDS